MDYKLAKKLNDGGFPNLGIYNHNYVEEPLNDPLKPGWDKKSVCKYCGEEIKYSSNGSFTMNYAEGCSVVSDYRFPTLSELIAACGDDFESLRMAYQVNEKYWIVKRYTTDEFFKGSTPEEAVSLLWLALNVTENK